MGYTPYQLYNGEETVEFHDKLHRYKWRGKMMPGVTSALGILDKPQLVQWAANTASEFWRENCHRVTAGSTPEDVHQEARLAHTRKRDEASGVGTIAHSYAEEKLKRDGLFVLPAGLSREQDVAMKAAIRAVDTFFNTHRVEVDFSERIVLSRDYGYCGTVDIVGKIDGVWGVWDFKTSKPYYRGKMYDTHKLQLAAYALPVEEEFGREVSKGGIIRLDKTTGVPELHPVDITPQLKDTWLQVFSLQKALKSI